MRPTLIIAFIMGLTFTYSLQIVAAIDISSCGSLTMANENYVLLQNITPAQSTMMTCLSVEAPGITLDCAGHSIFGNDYYVVGGWTLYSPQVVNTTFNNLVIKNCDIRASAGGISLSGNNFILKNNTVHGGKDYDSANDNYDRYGSGVSFYNYGTIENNTIEAGGAYAIYVAGGMSIPTIISNNTIIGPTYNSYVSGGGALSIFNNKLIIGGSGLDSVGSHQYAGVTSITLEGTQSVTVFDNGFSGSGNFGIYFKYDSGGSGSHTISNNTFDLGNAIGIYGNTGSHKIYDNLIKVSDAVGIQLQQSSYLKNNTITTNGIAGSTSYGIYFNNAGNMQLNDSKIFTSGANHVYIAGDGNYNYTFLNMSFNRSLVGFEPSSTNNFIVKWYLNITVLNSSGNILNNINLIAKKQNGDIMATGMTYQNGKVQLVLTEYERNVTSVVDNNPYNFIAYDSNGTYLNTSILINLTYSTEQNLTMAKTSVSYSTSVQPSPIEISNIATLRLNYTYASNSSPITGATVNLTIFDTTSSRTVLASGLPTTYVPSTGLWQYNYTTPTGTNGTYKYNIKGGVPGLLGSDFDTNGTFDTKDTTAPQISSLSTTTSCSGHSNYRLSNAAFDITFSATDNWSVNYTLCNLTLSNLTSHISVANSTICSFPTSGPAGSVSVRILVNDTANNTASSSVGVTVVDSCPAAPTSPPSQTLSSSSGGGGGGGGAILESAISGLPEIIFETRNLTIVQNRPEKLRITLKNPKKEPLMVTLEGPPEILFDEKEFTLQAGGGKEVYATISYSTAGDYKPFISAQLGDLKRMYDLSVTVAKREVDAVEQLLMDAQKTLNSLANLKGKACDRDASLIENKSMTLELLAQAIRRPILLGDKPSDDKVTELRLELSTASGLMSDLNECRPTVIQQQTDRTVQQLGKTKAFQIPALAAVVVLLFGAGLFRFLRRA